MIQKYFSLFFIAAVILSLVLVNRGHAATNGAQSSLNGSKAKETQVVKKPATKKKVMIKKAPVKKSVMIKKPKKKAPLVIKKASVKKSVTNGKVNGKNGKKMVKPQLKPTLSPTPLNEETTSMPQGEISNSAQ